MKVLLLGVTGRVGSRLLPALLAHRHQVVVYVRDPAKLSKEVTSRVLSVVQGSGTDSDKIRNAIVSNQCDSVVNAAGLAPALGTKGDLPAIFAAVVKAALDARKERDAPLRCWFLSGFSLLEHPDTGYQLMEYVPIYKTHAINYKLIKPIDTQEVAWSLFCASNMDPKSQDIEYDPSKHKAHNLVASAEHPPNWSQTMRWLPSWLLGNYLNVMAQAQTYFAPLEDCTDFIAADLDKGLKSEYVGKRVGVKVEGT